MKPSPEPTCPACGGTPASMIEDGYSTDLVPWWRHYVQKFNPFRRKPPPTRWIGWVELRGEGRRQWKEYWADDKAIKKALLLSLDPYARIAVSVVDKYDERHLWLFPYAKYWCPIPDLPESCSKLPDPFD